LTFKDIIFVFEDIDACSDIVLSRDKETRMKITLHQFQIIVSHLMIKLKILQMSAVAAVVAAVNSKDYEKDKKDQEMLLDKLNLSGLLNVLDGIVDTPNRVIVMTTNHPEKPIHMGLIKAKSAAEIQQYLALNELEILLGHSTIKPRKTYLEQKCSECSTVDELLYSLEGKFVEKQFLKVMMIQT
jgi:hypothetical protein